MKFNPRNFFIATAFLATSALSLSFGYRTASNKVAPTAVNTVVKSKPFSTYDSLHLNTCGLPRQAFDYAVKGVQRLHEMGKLDNTSIVTIIDFSQPSYNKRLYIVDLENCKVLFNTLVAHGRNSGKEMAESFSNTVSSLKSSPGFYVTGDTYIGGNGYSLKLNGMERGINDHALERAIVLHGADYVSPAFIRNIGYIGRSYGCPAVSKRDAQPIINTIKDGTCLFIYPPGKSYSTRSRLLI